LIFIKKYDIIFIENEKVREEHNNGRECNYYGR
jgi:hypothetical protein